MGFCNYTLVYNIWKDDVLNTVYDNGNDSIYWLVKKQHSSLWPIQHR